jgi:phage-related protein
MAERKLTVILAGSAKGLTDALGEADGKLGDFSKKAALAFAGAGLAAAGFGVASLKEFIGFEKQMNEVFTLLPGISKDAMGKMTDQVKGFSREFGVLPDKVVPALYQALSAGVPPDNVFTFLEVAQKAAKGGVTDLATAVDGISSVVNAYGAEVLDAAKASDLMFCLRLDQRVVTIDRGLVPIGELTEGAWVLAYDGQQFVEAWAEYVPQPPKPTVRVATRLGREIITTPNHPFLVERCRHGSACQRHSCKRAEWVEVQYLRPGDRIAVPTALGPAFGRVHVDEHKSGLLGLWLAEGDSKLASVSLTSTGYGGEIARWAEAWGCTVTTADSDIRHRIICKGQRNNPVTDWLRNLGLGDCSAATKHIPGEVFTWSRASVGTLLRWLFNGDGWLSATDDARRHGGFGYQLGFCSKSERLVRDVSHLLLRFGVVGRVRRRGDCEAWTWETSRYNEIKRFLDHIGLDRGSAATFLSNEPVKQRHRQNVVEFDPIVEIAMLGESPVADLFVEGLHNFVAEDIVAHNTAVRLGKTDFTQLSSSLFNVIPTAASLGIQFADVTAALARLTAQGTPTSVATTQLRALFVEASRDSTKLAGAIKQVSGQSFPELIRSGKNVGEILQMVRGSMPDDEFRQLFSSVEASGAALGITGPQFEAFSDALNEMKASAGATDAAFKTMDRGIGSSLAKIKAGFAVLMLDVGEKLAPAFARFTDFLVRELPPAIATVQGYVQRFSDYLSANVVPVVVRLGDAVLPVARAIGVYLYESLVQLIRLNLQVLGVLKDVFEAMAPTVREVASIIADELEPPLARVLKFIKDHETEIKIFAVAFMVLAPAVYAVAAAHAAQATAATAAGVATGVALLPVLAITAALAGLVLGIKLLIDNWDDLTERYPILESITNALKDAFSAFAGWITSDFVPAVKSIYETVSEVVEDVYAVIKQVWDKIEPLIQIQVDAWKLVIETAWDGIKLYIETVLGVIKGIVDVFMGIFTGDWGRAWDGVKQVVDSLWEGIRGAFNLGRDFLLGLIPIMADAGRFIGSALAGGLHSAIKAGINGMLGLIESGFNKALSAVASGIAKLKSAIDAIPGANPFGNAMQAAIDGLRSGISIPRLAMGGIVLKPTLALIGEAGPEAVVPLNRAGPAGIEPITVNIQVAGDLVTKDRSTAEWHGRNMGFGIVDALRARGLA